MKIIIPTLGIAARQHTSRLLEAAGVEHVLVCHTRQQEATLHAVLPDANVVVSGQLTLVDQRNWICTNLVRTDEWYVGMDDNVQGFTAVHDDLRDTTQLATSGPPPAGFASWRRAYNQPLDIKSWLRLLEYDVAAADRYDAALVGVATMENPYFRGRHFSHYRFVKTKVFAMRNDPRLHFKHEQCHDSYLSALSVAVHGRVLVDNYLHHVSKMYEAGGLGNRQQREANGLMRQMEATCTQFPGLVTIGRGANTALRFRLCTESGVNRWRRENGYAEQETTDF